MDDKRIVDLYFARSERAIAETDKKYGRYCRSIAYHILQSDEDSEECVNDTYLKRGKPYRLIARIGCPPCSGKSPAI